MEFLTHFLIFLVYLFWGILQTKHLYDRGRFTAMEDGPDAFLATLIWPAVYFFEVVLSRKEKYRR